MGIPATGSGNKFFNHLMMNIGNAVADSVERRDQLVLGEEELIGPLFEHEAPPPTLGGGEMGAPGRRPRSLSFFNDVEVVAVTRQAQRGKCDTQGKQYRVTIGLDCLSLSAGRRSQTGQARPRGDRGDR